MLLVGRREAIKSRLRKLTISVTCIDERIAARPQPISFRVPGANILPKGDEPSFTLAAILFLIKVMEHFDAIRLVVADHGTLGNSGYFGCGMMAVNEIIPQIEEKIRKENVLSIEQINRNLSMLALRKEGEPGAV